MGIRKLNTEEQATKMETEADLRGLPMSDMDDAQFFRKWERVNKFVPLEAWQEDIEDNSVIAASMQKIIEDLAPFTRDAHVDIYRLVDNKTAAREIHRTVVEMDGESSIEKAIKMNLRVRGHASGYTVCVNDTRIHIGCWDHADVMLELARPEADHTVFLSLRLAVLKSWQTGYSIAQILEAIRANLPK